MENLKEEADELMKTEGNVKGVVFQTHASYIRDKEGEEGLRLVEEKMKELGYPIKFSEVGPFKWYRESQTILVILVAKEIFHWRDSDVFSMGNAAPKYSLMVKLLMKYFLSPRTTLMQSPKYWAKHYNFGKLEIHEYNEKEKRMSVRVKEYKTHPIVCIFHRGYFLRMAQYVIKSQEISIEETKCVYRGDPYHEYTVTWK